MKRIFLSFFAALLSLFILAPHGYTEEKNPIEKVKSAVTDGTIETARGYLDFVAKEEIPAADIVETVDQFIQLSPTIEETNEYTATYGKTEDASIYVQLKSYLFATHLPQNMDELMKLMEYKLPSKYKNNQLTKDINTYLWSYIEEKWDLFLGFKPTVEQINELISKYPSVPKNALYIKLYEYAFEQFPPKNVDEFFEILHCKDKHRDSCTTEYHEQLFSKIISPHMELFLSFNPTTEQISTLTTNFGFTKDPAFFINLKKYAMEKFPPTTVTELFSVLDCASRPVNYNVGQYGQELFKFVEGHLELFLGFNPTIEQVNTLTSKYGYTKETAFFLRLKNHVLSTHPPKNINEFFTLIEYALPRGEEKTKEYQEERFKLIERHIDLFKSYNPTMDDISKLARHCHVDNPAFFIDLKKYAFEKFPPKNADELFALLKCATPQYEYSTVQFKQEFFKFIESHLALFLRFNPTVEQISTFTASCTVDNPAFFINLKKYAMEKFPPKNVDELFSVFSCASPPNEYFTDQHKEALFRFVESHLELFLSFNPTSSQINTLMSRYGYTKNPSFYLRLKKHDLVAHPPKDFNEYLEIMKFVFPSVDIKNQFKDTVNPFIIQKENIELLFRFNPTPQDLDRLTLKLLSIFKEPVTFSSMQKYINKQQINVLKEIKRVCNNEVLKKDTDGNMMKYLYLQKMGDRNIKHFSNEINTRTEEALKKAAQMNKKDRAEICQLLYSLECDLNRIIERAKNDLFQLTTARDYLLIPAGDWRIPKTQLKNAMDKELDELLRQENASRKAAPKSAENDTDCSICCEPMETKITTSCGHTACKTCYERHIHDELEEKKLPLHCFQKGCQKLLQEADLLKAGLHDDQLTYVKKQTKLNLPCVIRCPRNFCDRLSFLPQSEDPLALVDKAVTSEEKCEMIDKIFEHEVLCGKCFIGICSKCGRSAHKGFGCNEMDKFREFIGEKAFMYMVDGKLVQYCPKCNAPVIRQDGCASITCRCGHKFPYVGEYRIDPSITTNPW